MKASILFALLVVACVEVQSKVVATPFVLFYGRDFMDRYAAVIEIQIKNSGNDDLEFYSWSCLPEIGMSVMPETIRFKEKLCTENSPTRRIIGAGETFDLHTVLVSDDPMLEEEIRILIGLYEDYMFCADNPLINKTQAEATELLGERLLRVPAFRVYQQ